MKKSFCMIALATLLALPALAAEKVAPAPAAAVDGSTPQAPANPLLATPSAAADVAAALAVDKANPIPEGALEITATGTLEWLRQDQIYVANQNAVARHNGTTLKGDVLKAYYQNPPPGPDGKKKGSNQITRVTAEGNPVELIASNAVVYGQHGDYDVDKHIVHLTGDNLKLVTTDEVVTAKDSFDYFEDTDTGVATGDAVLLRGFDKLTADVISAKFVHKDADAKPAADKKAGDQKSKPVTKQTAQSPPPKVDAYGDAVKPHALDHLDGKGHVVLVTQTDLVTGDLGTYSPITDTATVTGHVHVTREDNQMDGARAEVDMATGISRMFAAPGQKVHALFVPKKKDPKDAKDKTVAQDQSTQAPQ